MLKPETCLLAMACAQSLLQPLNAGAPTDNLVIYYSFTGNTLDGSIEKNDGVASRAALTTDRFGNPASAYRLNGTNSFIQAKRALPDSQSVTVSLWLSLESWVQLSNWSAPQVVFFEGDDSPGNDVALYVMGGFHFTTKGTTTLSYPNWLPPLKSWTHVVCVADAVNKKAAMWINGEKVVEKPFTDAADIGYHAPFNLGRRPGVYNDWFLAGEIDEVRVYTRALNAAEIGELYNSDAGVAKTLDAQVESMRLTLHTSVGGRYILQASSDMRNWSDFGSAFVADVSNYQVSVPANESRRFWRFVEAP